MKLRCSAPLPLPHAREEVLFAGIAAAESRAWCLLKNLVQLLPRVRIREPGTMALGNVSGIINRIKMVLPWRRIICLATALRVLRAIGPLVCPVIIILTVLFPA